MKAISLWQPWATLMALGLKKIETRSWATKYRGALAIHAAKNVQISTQRLFFEDLNKAGLLTNFPSIDDMPRGGIIALVNLVDCQKITLENTPEGFEHSFGDYTSGRFMWLTENVKAFKKPIPFIGRQGLFNVPGEALRVCRVCGCSEFNAREGGCSWVEEDLCNACL